jgi:hypothetical protein
VTTLCESVLAVSLRIKLRVHFDGLLAEHLDELFRRDLAALGALVNGFGFRGWDIPFVLEAADDARGVAGLLGGGAGVFGRAAHLGNYIVSAIAMPDDSSQYWWVT